MLDIPSCGITPFLLDDASLPLPIPVAIVLFVGGLVAYAAVNAIEIAVVAANRIRVRAALEEGSRSARAIEWLKSHQETFFGMIVIIQNVSVFLASTAGTVVAVDEFGRWGYFVSLIAVPLIAAEFGEYTPKVIASRAAERIAFATALPVEWFARLVQPVTRALTIVPNIFSTEQTRLIAYSMLLNRGTIRIGLPIPANVAFTLTAVDDPYHFASAAEPSRRTP